MPEIEETQKTIKERVREAEKQEIESALLKYKYNKTKVAKAIGVSLKTLYNKMKALNIE